MCGICGIVSLSKELSAAQLKSLATQMADSLKHRGPDDWGVWVDPSGTCALAQRRLSIIDLSPAGHQPMIHTATDSALTFNGEIYNYQELKDDLIAKGHNFTGSSDTEVLLTGLMTEGPSFIDRLDGMFAFGLFDSRSRTLTLARDIFGEKPLYYTRTKSCFAFASELQALALVPDFDPTITLDTIATYLALQYVPAPQTIYSNARKLPAAHTLSLAADGQETIRRTYRFVPSPQQTGTRSLDDLTDELDALLTETVRTRLISDVPLGAFLSGGVDSSLIVAIASKHMSEPVQTFSIGFEGSADSEHEEARRMAGHLHTQHYDRILKLDALDMGQHIASVLDEPNGDTSCLPVWVLSKMTRERVTVALSGDGGDELFGGYNRYYRTLEDAKANEGHPWSIGSNYYSPRILIFGDQALTKFLGAVPSGTQALLEGLRTPLDATEFPILQRLRQTDIENYMPGAVLPKVDRMSMQHALEVRAPLLGRKIADFAARMAADDLCKPDQTKILLKHLAARYIPRTWIDQTKKGFGLPIQGWGGNELTQAVAALLTDPTCCLGQWIDGPARERFLAYHRTTPSTYQLWAVYILELWLRANKHKVG